jgi:hypothetical protein
VPSNKAAAELDALKEQLAELYVIKQQLTTVLQGTVTLKNSVSKHYITRTQTARYQTTQDEGLDNLQKQADLFLSKVAAADANAYFNCQ